MKNYLNIIWIIRTNDFSSFRLVAWVSLILPATTKKKKWLNDLSRNWNEPVVLNQMNRE